METPSYSDLIGHLREDADDATWNIGYMKAVVDEPMVRDKLDGSFTGYALEVANAAVKRSLALYCARAWDRARDAVSLPNLVKRLPPADELRLARKQWVDDQAFQHLVQKVESQHTAFLLEFNAATGSGALGALRVFRTEFLAHRVIHSADRKKLENTNSVGAITLHELVNWAVQTVTMVGELGFLWDGLSNPYPERIARTTRYCREFWRVLPVLGDAEDLRNVRSADPE